MALTINNKESSRNDDDIIEHSASICRERIERLRLILGNATWGGMKVPGQVQAAVSFLEKWAVPDIWKFWSSRPSKRRRGKPSGTKTHGGKKRKKVRRRTKQTQCHALPVRNAGKQ